MSQLADSLQQRSPHRIKGGEATVAGGGSFINCLQSSCMHGFDGLISGLLYNGIFGDHNLAQGGRLAGGTAPLLTRGSRARKGREAKQVRGVVATITIVRASRPRQRVAALPFPQQISADL
jgi:hypothetical protein